MVYISPINPSGHQTWPISIYEFVELIKKSTNFIQFSAIKLWTGNYIGTTGDQNGKATEHGSLQFRAFDRWLSRTAVAAGTKKQT